MREGRGSVEKEGGCGTLHQVQLSYTKWSCPTVFGHRQVVGMHQWGDIMLLGDTTTQQGPSLYQRALSQRWSEKQMTSQLQL